MIKLQEFYKWEIVLKDGTVLNEDDRGKTKFKNHQVERFSLKPQIAGLPEHNIWFNGFQYEKRFGRGFMNRSSVMLEYLHCLETNKFRIWCRSSNGSIAVTPKDYEFNI